MTALSELFVTLQARNEAAFIAYAMCGYPNLDQSEQLAEALIEGGADALEIGVPFSDPLADGVTVQRAGQVALEQGIRLQDCLGLVERLHSRHDSTPLMLMG